MRDIKFRAWDSFNNRMIQNDRILKICFVRSDHIPSLVVYSNRNIENHTEIRENDKQYCNEFELMQYTGLKDKNGKDIYEGDILTSAFSKRIVIFDENTCSFMLKDIDLRNELFSLTKEKSKNLEIIGNIYENKELIGEKEQ